MLAHMDRPDIPDFFQRPSKNNFDPDKFLHNNRFLIITLVILLLVLPNLVIVVGPGQRGVVFNRLTGMEKRVLEDGWQIVIPFIQDVTIYDTRESNYIFTDKNSSTESGYKALGNPITALTNDGQKVQIHATVRLHPDRDQLWWVHKNIPRNRDATYEELIVMPVVSSVVRDVLSSYSVSALYSEDRATIGSAIAEQLKERLGKYKIVLNEFLLQDVVFSIEYQNAIERKERVRIELDTKDNIIAEEKLKRDAVITRAEGEAAAIRMRAQVLNNYPGFLDYLRARVYGKRTKLIIEEDI